MSAVNALTQAHAAAQIDTLLAGKSSTFASIDYVTEVATSAAHRDAGVKIEKHTTANVMLFANLKAATDVYSNAVKKTAGRIEENDEQAVEEFVKSGNYFEHTQCFSIVQHKTKPGMYLWCMYNNAQSEYFVNGAAATKQEVAQYLTPSAAKALMEDKSVVYNKRNDVLHTVIVRTIALHNLRAIRACGQAVTL